MNSTPDEGQLSAVAVEVLLTLAEGPSHGYAIKRAIEMRAGNDVVIGSGSLYQAVHRLERRGFLAEAAEPGDSGDARRGRTYRLEEAGRRALQHELARMRRILSHARRRQVMVDPEGTR